MDFKETDNELEFDFSVLAYTTPDNFTLVESEKPSNIEDEVFNLLIGCVKNIGEYRFVGVIDIKDGIIGYFINRLYAKSNRVWENVFYDELARLLENAADDDNFHRVHNCLIY